MSLSDNTEVALKRLRTGAAVILEHHVFDSRSGWVQREAWKQPKIRLSVRPCGGIYPKLDITAPSAGPVMVNGIADTGAQACLWGVADFYEAGYKKQDLVKVKQRIAAANRHPIDIMGAVFLTVEANSLTTNMMVFVTPDIQGLYLSRQVLTELYVIPKSFPRAGDTKPKARAEEFDRVTDRAPCGCLRRRNPPQDPTRCHSYTQPATSPE